MVLVVWYTLPTYHARPKLLAWRWSAVSKHGWVARATNLVGSAEIMTGRRRRLLLFRLGLLARWALNRVGSCGVLRHVCVFHMLRAIAHVILSRAESKVSNSACMRAFGLMRVHQSPCHFGYTNNTPKRPRQGLTCQNIFT